VQSGIKGVYLYKMSVFFNGPIPYKFLLLQFERGTLLLFFIPGIESTTTAGGRGLKSTALAGQSCFFINNIL